MMSMILSWLGSLLGGPFVTAALNAYKAKLDAGNNAETIAANLAIQQAQIDTQREALEQRTVDIEEGKYFPLVRWGFAFPFIVFNFKVIIWDRVLHWGITDVLSTELSSLEQVIVAAYFGHSAVSIIGRALSKKA